MCIAFPKAADDHNDREPAWKSRLLFLPRLASLIWLLIRMMGSALFEQLREKPKKPA